MSGFGPRTDWLLNLAANGEAHIDIGRHSYDTAFRHLTLEEAEEAVADYERRNAVIRPIITSVLSHLLGWRYDGSAAARARLVAQLPVIEFRRRSRQGATAEG